MVQNSMIDFGAEISRLMPLMLREVARRQKGAITKGNLAVSHIVVLELLKENGACTMGTLARVLDLTMSAATSIVDKMIGEGLVKRERSQEDRRVVRVSLLKKGTDIVELVKQERRAVTNEMFKVLTDHERAEYLRLFRKIVGSISRESTNT